MDTNAGAVLIYLAYLAILAWIQPLPARRRVVVSSFALLDAAIILALAYAPGRGWQVVRDWQPPLQILVCYWLSGAFFRAPMLGLEAWQIGRALCRERV